MHKASPSPDFPMRHPDESTLRMIDANLNRSREGLRVLEDCARFVLNDADLSERLKLARHALRSGIDALGLHPDALVRARNTPGDVGTTIKAEQELVRRQGMHDLVSAAAKRATEALRVIEEAAKAIGATGSVFESTRYALYDIERDLILKLRPPCPQWALCVLVTESLCTHHRPERVLELAAEGGAGCVQIREKSMPDAAFLEYAGRLTARAQQLGLHVMINDRAHIARLIGADGVHLGQDDLPIAAARSVLGPGFWIGRTCPTLEHAVEAVSQGADSCGLGPVFASATKHKSTLAGISLIESFLSDPFCRSTPMLAISGIDAHNIGSLAQIHCPGVAVSSAVCSSEQPGSVCRTIVEAITRRSEQTDPTMKP